MSISIKVCSSCGQINPAASLFCPTCGSALASIPATAAPWTFAGSFPPQPEALRPVRPRRRISNGQGSGLAWLGFILVLGPIVVGARGSILAASWSVGLLLALAGFWRMRRDRHTLERAGFVTNAAAVLTLAAIVFKLIDSTDASDSAAPPPLPTTVEATSTSDSNGTPNTMPASISGSSTVAMFRGDPAHTGAMAGPGPAGRIYRAWRFDAGGEIYSSPAVADGLVYVGSKSGFLYALDERSGAERWRKDLGEYIVRSSPAVVDGAVYIGGGYSLFALDAAFGKDVWKGIIPFAGPSSPTVLDGVVYIGSQGGGVYAFDVATGKQLWRFQAEGLIFSSPAVVGGSVFIGTDSGKVYALNAASGQASWTKTVDGGVYASPAVANGLVYVTSKGPNGQFVQALAAKGGDKQWSYAAGGESSAAVSAGAVIVTGADGGVYAFDAAAGGDPKWLFPTGAATGASPAVADGVVYIASGRTLFAVDERTGAEKWRYAAGYTIETSPVVVDGLVLIGGRDGFLDAIAGDGQP